MKKEIIESIKSDKIIFKCVQCGNCCSGASGYVWLTKEEQIRISEFLQIPLNIFIKKFVRKVNGKISLKEIKESDTNYRCVFLDADNRCGIYECRPNQCITYPYWKKILEDKDYLDYVANDCPGIKIIRNKAEKN